MRVLEGKSILVTGASGLIGQAFVRHLSLRTAGRVKIWAAGRNPDRLRRLFDGCLGVRAIDYAQALWGRDVPQLDCIVHAASVTSPALYVSEPEMVRRVNVDDLRRLLNLAHRQRDARLLFISSSEVYGHMPSGDAAEPFEETKWGVLDESSPRSSYARAKREAEELCRTEACAGADIVIVRPSYVYGPEASPGDSRIASAFLWAAARGRDIVLKSAGEQKRMFVHSADCARAIIRVLESGEVGEAYNIADDGCVLSIREFAEACAKAGGVSIRQEEANRRERETFNPMAHALLSTARIRRLGWQTEISVSDGIAQTIHHMRADMGRALDLERNVGYNPNQA